MRLSSAPCSRWGRTATPSAGTAHSRLKARSLATGAAGRLFHVRQARRARLFARRPAFRLTISAYRCRCWPPDNGVGWLCLLPRPRARAPLPASAAAGLPEYGAGCADRSARPASTRAYRRSAICDSVSPRANRVEQVGQLFVMPVIARDPRDKRVERAVERVLGHPARCSRAGYACCLPIPSPAAPGCIAINSLVVTPSADARSSAAT